MKSILKFSSIKSFNNGEFPETWVATCTSLEDVQYSVIRRFLGIASGTTDNVTLPATVSELPVADDLHVMQVVCTDVSEATTGVAAAKVLLDETSYTLTVTSTAQGVVAEYKESDEKFIRLNGFGGGTKQAALYFKGFDSSVIKSIQILDYAVEKVYYYTPEGALPIVISDNSESLDFGEIKVKSEYAAGTSAGQSIKFAVSTSEGTTATLTYDADMSSTSSYAYTSSDMHMSIFVSTDGTPSGDCEPTTTYTLTDITI